MKTPQNKDGNINSSIKLSWDRYSSYTAEASKIGRQLAFSEGAIFWVLYISIHCINNRPKILLIVFYLILIAFFIFDLLQYLIGALKFEKKAEILKNVKKQNSDKELNYSIGDETGRSLNIFYITKFVFLAIATVLLIVMFTIFNSIG